jgi:adenylate cyclase
MTPEGFKRKLTTIFSADVHGYSRLMGEDEDTTVRTITAYRDILAALIHDHGGNVIDSPGDNLLAEFGSVVDAVKSAVAIQKEIKTHNDELPENRKMRFRIGINLGDVIEGEGRIYGDGVNIAARLEGLSEPGGICISKTIFDHIENKLPYEYDFIGEQKVKNIAKRVSVYRIKMDSGDAAFEPHADIKTAKTLRTQVFIVITAVLILVMAAGIWQFHFRHSDPKPAVSLKKTPLTEKPAIAVLPFDNMSNNPEHEYFSDGMTEEIITKLSMNQRLAVIARNSTFFYKGRRIKIQQVARELNAKYVVEGSVRRAGNMVRITAQLIDAETESHLWAKTYDREFKDVFSLQDEIAQQIAAALSIKSREAEQARAWRIPTENLTAYDFFLRGLSHFLRVNKEENIKAKAMFQRAVELDPQYAGAYVFLGYTHLVDLAFGMSRDPRALEKVSELARKAIALNDSLPLAHVLLADVYRSKGQFEQAIAHAERSLSLNPSDPSAYRSMGNSLNAVGRSEEAITAIKKAMLLDPHYAVYYNTDLAGAYRNLGRYTEAIASSKEALARNPNWVPAYFELAMNYSMAWRISQNPDPLMLDRALDTAKKLMAIENSSLVGHFTLGIIYLYQRQYEKARVEAEKMIALAPENGDGYAMMAAILLSSRKSKEAIHMVNKAMQLNPAVPAWYLSLLGNAYASSDRLADAVKAHQRVFLHYPTHADTLNAHLDLVLLYDALNREEDARQEAEAVLKLVPNFSVAIWGQRNPAKDSAQTKRSMAVLRKAGLK